MEQIKQLNVPNSPNKTHFMTQISPDFMMKASSQDTERLSQLLPYKSLVLTSVSGYKGIFAMINRNENRDIDIVDTEYRENYIASLINCKHDILDKTNCISIQYEARNLDNFLDEMSVKHVVDSVAVLIANHIRVQMWDGRYSSKVKDWVKNHSEIRVPITDNSMIPKINNSNVISIPVDFLSNEYTLGNTHPVIVNFACQWVIQN